MKLTKQEFLALSGVDAAGLCTWLDEKWLVPDESSREMLFSDIDIARAHFVRDLREKWGSTTPA